VDPKIYGRLPTAIHSEAENERLLSELRDLDRRFDALSPEERAYAELLTVLIEAFEDEHYALEGSTPQSRLRSLMEERGLRQRDLLEVFGSRGVASEVVNGKREISKAQAKSLASIFHVPADLFL
jgi:HTH-type transcriptional regulator/antitoxin HigA